MTARYLSFDANGNFLEIVAIDESTGASDAGKIIALDSAGLIPVSMLPSDVGLAVYEIPASETLAAGDFVNIWNDGGTPRVRRADASNGAGFQAHGYVNAGVTSGETASVLTDFKNTGQTGMTPGAAQFLSATNPGRSTETAPTTATHIAQYLGVAVNATLIDVEIARPVIRA